MKYKTVIKDVKKGNSFTVCLDEIGRVYFYGILEGNEQNLIFQKEKITQLTTSEKILEISIGNNHIVGLSEFNMV